MVILAWNKIADFCAGYPNASEALLRWYLITYEANWKNIHDIIQDFGYVDAVGNDRFVFNVGGNKYRLVAMIHFNTRTVYIRFIGPHHEYDKINCSTI
jgi:mRNA interferase HigB